MELGPYIKSERLKQKLSTRKLSSVIGASSSYISHLEKGKIKTPKLEVIAKIFDALKISQDMRNYFLNKLEIGDYYEDSITDEMKRNEMIVEIVNDLQGMEIQDLLNIQIMMNRYKPIYTKIGELHRNHSSNSVLQGMEDYVDFLHNKYLK